MCLDPGAMRLRLCCWRLFLIVFLFLGIISYEFDLHSTFFYATLPLFGHIACGDTPDSYLIVRHLTESISDRCRDHGHGCKLKAITGSHLGGSYMGLGNQMFVLASVYGIGKSVGADLVVGCQYSPKLTFLNQFRDLAMDRGKRLSSFVSKNVLDIKKETPASGRCCAYGKIDGRLFENGSKYDMISINGFLQSWKYFDYWKPEVLEMFTFNPSVVAKADKDFRKLIGKYRWIGDHAGSNNRFNNDQADRKTRSDTQIHYGCVHIRRGDLLKESSRDRGYIFGDSKTVQSAIRFLNQTLINDQIRFKIILFSDDPIWCLSEFSSNDGQILVMGPQSASVAMQTMSQYCDTFLLVSSSSTFGWWASYLSRRGARVFYNQRMVVNGSSLEIEIVKEDFFLPDWVPVDLGV